MSSWRLPPPLLACLLASGAATLVVLTAVAALPALLLGAAEARRPAPGSLAAAGPVLLVVRGSRERWFVNGQPMGQEALGRLLRRSPNAEVRLRPAAPLAAAQVGASLAWLERQLGRPVPLELPPP